VTSYQYDLAVIGGGSGGLLAARLAAALGGRVVLIDKVRLGGDCLRYGCVPSKTLIHVAKVVHGAHRAAELGLAPAELTADMARVSQHVQSVIQRVGEADQIYVKDVAVRFGKVSFRSARELQLDNDILPVRNVIIATGSSPQVPPIAGLREVPYLTNEDLFDLTCLPRSLIVVGGGPIGCEMAQAFARLGSRVTIIQRLDRLLPREEPEVSGTIAAAFQRDGITVLTGVQVERVRQENSQKVVEARSRDRIVSFAADDLLIALGRRPNVSGLNLEAAGVQYDAKGIQVDDHLQTSASGIYAIGDVIGGYLFTHVAAYHAGVATRNALLPVARKKVDYRVVPWVTFTDPEAARVGLTEADARAKLGKIRVVRLPWSEIDRAQTEGATDGFIKLVLAGKGDKIIGAHLVGAGAGEVLGEVTLAMQHNLGLNAILATIHAYPTLTTSLQQAAFEGYLQSRARANARRLIRSVLALRS
jgi:pyruvate/2-oxoglutarate dehydrogenase complex dihydrolipoamide dehydrogenase (E3) component